MTAKPKPTKQKRTRKFSKSRRAILEKQLEAIVKLLIFWRDGQECVQTRQDGGRCGNGLMWGHYISQKQSHYLKFDLGNVFVQCGSHNNLDFRGDKSYSLWFIQTFGTQAAEAMESARKFGQLNKRSIADLEEMLAHYDDLYQNRFYVDTTFDGLVQGGYYGAVIKSAIMEAKCTNKLP